MHTIFLHITEIKWHSFMEKITVETCNFPSLYWTTVNQHVSLFKHCLVDGIELLLILHKFKFHCIMANPVCDIESFVYTNSVMFSGKLLSGLWNWLFCNYCYASKVVSRTIPWQNNNDIIIFLLLCGQLYFNLNGRYLHLSGMFWDRKLVIVS